ncbi:hypothetical protein GCM10018793_22630 [Streptomyces sulfonofaciens]|uniref:Penicillin-insensitive transglycosylase n=1 Tax=Streptomyces sulfonofaciens TaxID=68272 RepID=A0A919G354_9ACTN|nr:transglycosylase domain-containing protein [Streptomyces sulfonofaciens]GHH76591.1 hypothetical protein GCM10018793_22630 [Streptomyces sulfonofaciens]
MIDEPQQHDESGRAAVPRPPWPLRPAWAPHQPFPPGAPGDGAGGGRRGRGGRVVGTGHGRGGGASWRGGRRGSTGPRGRGRRPHRPGGPHHPGDPARTGAAPSRAGRARQRGKRPGRKGLRRLVPTWRMLLGATGGLVLLLAGGFTAGYLLVAIPAANAAATAQSNVFLYADGTQFARDGDVNRENVSLDRVPKHVRRAVLAAEDRDFYYESAVDPQAMIRAAWNTVTGKGRQSGSTITQQYVKNYYLDQDQTVTRKVKEFFIAIKLDREQSKRHILQGYLNTSYFGRNAYGIQAAAQAYYGVDASDLDVAQGAYLATLLNAPSAYDVVAHPENRPKVLSRWRYVLDGMAKEHWLSPGQRARAAFPAPRSPHAGSWSGLGGQRGYLVQAVKDYLVGHHVIGRNAHGYRITTTLHRHQQDAFAAAVDDQLLSRLDKRARRVDRTVRAGGVAVDPGTGKVIAMYGGIDYTKQYVNNATRRDYQVGSAFKPFVLAAAVQHGAVDQHGHEINPSTTYDGTDQRPVRGWRGRPYAPQNEDHVDYGPISVREATDKSVNAVYAQMAVDVGPDKVRSTAIGLGLPADTRDMPKGPAIALGTATASALDLAQAYATLANHGRHAPYTLVERVTKDGRNVALPPRPVTQAVNREAADTTTAVLRGVVDGGTGTAARAVGRPAAGKTGTAEDDKAAWFAGYTPDLATVVTVMGQDPDTGAHTSLYGALGEPRINGGDLPARIWARFTDAALDGKLVHDFDLWLQPGAEESASPSPGEEQPPGEQGGDVGGQDAGGTGDDPGRDTGGTDPQGPPHEPLPDQDRTQPGQGGPGQGLGGVPPGAGDGRLSQAADAGAPGPPGRPLAAGVPGGARDDRPGRPGGPPPTGTGP